MLTIFMAMVGAFIAGYTIGLNQIDDCCQVDDNDNDDDDNDEWYDDGEYEYLK